MTFAKIQIALMGDSIRSGSKIVTEAIKALAVMLDLRHLYGLDNKVAHKENVEPVLSYHDLSMPNSSCIIWLKACILLTIIITCTLYQVMLKRKQEICHTKWLTFTSPSCQRPVDRAQEGRAFELYIIPVWASIPFHAFCKTRRYFSIDTEYAFQNISSMDWQADTEVWKILLRKREQRLWGWHFQNKDVYFVALRELKYFEAAFHTF